MTLMGSKRNGDRHQKNISKQKLHNDWNFYSKGSYFNTDSRLIGTLLSKYNIFSTIKI